MGKIKGIILYKCKQNVNRVYRLCYIYNIKNLYLVNCKGYKLGNVFSAKDKVNIIEVEDIKEINGRICALEKDGANNLNMLTECDYILLGGENSSITSKMCKNKVRIDTDNMLCLTVDEALAIALFYIKGK